MGAQQVLRKWRGCMETVEKVHEQLDVEEVRFARKNRTALVQPQNTDVKWGDPTPRFDPNPPLARSARLQQHFGTRTSMQQFAAEPIVRAET
eukprot:1881118-Prymnesium_polylepis.1